VAYPNSGETYDAATKTWNADGNDAAASLAAGAGDWWKLGARVIGGCCRTTPRDIASLAAHA